ncbi:hypothetical protein NQ318_014840 [Aromia moschata]|uniref:Uncharacterized protein n=1 Tax=Aromia moschata TaxID=1265417 RepID=A0AAV8XCL8_9CUCU|nr:hypothetical protein NQ318_014840 [Aromia moschata]
MTQRVKHCPNSLNLETVACEKYISRLLQKEKLGTTTLKPTTLTTNPPRRVVKQSIISTTSANQNQLIKVRPNIKQQNLPSPKSTQSPADNAVQYADDSALVEVTVKTTNPRQRSRSTVADREPWGQLLKQHKSSEKVSVFSNFDPLRTLHFLAKELQHHLQAILPDDSNIQQMVADMQYALKRVPPEVASIVHLQQAIDLLPTKRSSKCLDDHNQPERLKVVTSEKRIQTDPTVEDEETKKLQRVMEESTLKLEISCRQMEALCEQLKSEKQFVEKQLQTERDSVKKKNKSWKQRQTKSIAKMETRSAASATELKATLSELKASKSALEQECNKLKHQLRLSAIEKEKYSAVLAVRDRQISEIQSEMTQLQEVVNEQLMELHNNAFASMPSNQNIPENAVAKWSVDQNKEIISDIGDATLSTIHTDHDAIHRFFTNKQNNDSFKELPCGDSMHEISENYFRRNEGYSTKEYKSHPLERPDSQASIRCLFNELKKTAYDIVGTQSHS